ncbi:complex I NDUFA9 subunit family protein [Steroidobacter sp. S1-65]|uniref:Complex I NDUFA9 subunit family protein n=1 Tax=Steroidobacter gossypii TaxID=2805490 RepID=A0ABS1X3R2_9GAMM|nr:complex I NDUFA9 subunit family protein [Steroidobacter gossypii]MBM0107832.1 complex I NDUFA9 subunit family protein [Steroidobacter gossypii]
MQPSSASIVTVFGGTGFLGRRIVRHLLDRNVTVRVATRHSQRARQLFGTTNVEPTTADVHDERSVAEALSGARGAVNAVSLYVEQGGVTFQSVHVEAARRIASIARRNGLERLVHVSGIGVDAASSSPYIRSRGQGEQAVESEFAHATFIRPAVMFGPDDAFLTVILKLLRRLPVYPMFGGGHTRLQPAYVEDVAQAAASLLQIPESPGRTLECAGPNLYTYRDLLKTIKDRAQVRTVLVPVPFSMWHALACVAELLPRPPLTRNQVELMEVDSVAGPDVPGFDQLAITPLSSEAFLPMVIESAA